MAADAASESITLFYAMLDFDRSKTQDEFEQLVYRTTLMMANQETSRSKIEHHGDDALRKEMQRRQSTDGKEDVLDMIEWLTTSQSAPQETRLYAKQVYEKLQTIPPSLSAMAFKMAGGANVIEAAKELKLSVSDAIDLQQGVRTVTNAMFEIDAEANRAP